MLLSYLGVFGALRGVTLGVTVGRCQMRIGRILMQFGCLLVFCCRRRNFLRLCRGRYRMPIGKLSRLETER